MLHGSGRGWLRRSGLGVDTASCFLEANPSASVGSGGVGGFILGSAFLTGTELEGDLVRGDARLREDRRARLPQPVALSSGAGLVIPK